jgi:hypothetical protein
VVRSAIEAAAFAALQAGLGWKLTSDEGALIGTCAAWLGSTIGTVWMLKAREVSQRAFWWAFGGGFAIRLFLLAALVIFAARNPQRPSGPLLVSYAVGVLFMLLIEYRHVKLK